MRPLALSGGSGMIFLVDIIFFISTMYNKDTQKDWLGSAISGAIGGGVLTSWAVVQGQSLGIAILITGISAGVAVLCHKFDII
jgi:hypothetical protein